MTDTGLRSARSWDYYKKCNYKGKLQEGLCKSCEDEARVKKFACKHCKEKVGGKQKGLECGKCLAWHHSQCQDEEVETYEVLQRNNKKIYWICSVCNPQVKKSLKGDESEQEEIQKIRKELYESRETNKAVMKKMNEMQGQLKNGENRGNDQGDFEGELVTIKKMMEKQKEKLDEMEKRMDERDEELVRRVTERMNENLEEREDKERRKNVMMFNVEESEKEDVKEREKDDKEMCEYVFKEKLGVEGVEVVKVYRLGTKSRGRERPMVACLTVREALVAFPLTVVRMRQFSPHWSKVSWYVGRTRLDWASPF
ncbi:hypothetical protein GWK47_019810 [Chionoecetes opilio]|uniref:PHD-type domain-containing protein n=1 Tax=Chionoecetes opilio TaxID=41210 RepID=A0A8J5CHW7_CHIOP|nr:hypothetical protein GWK47_019810 [Chionoecetes opilio]